jgi:translation elongation factor P/translation initiation factor 5A
MYETGKITGKGAEMLIPKDELEFLEKYGDEIYKMDRQDFLMAQIDLDPIESNYS